MRIIITEGTETICNIFRFTYLNNNLYLVVAVLILNVSILNGKDRVGYDNVKQSSILLAHHCVDYSQNKCGTRKLQINPKTLPCST